jgi:hypothetical protein
MHIIFWGTQKEHKDDFYHYSLILSSRARGLASASLCGLITIYSANDCRWWRRLWASHIQEELNITINWYFFFRQYCSLMTIACIGFRSSSLIYTTSYELGWNYGVYILIREVVSYNFCDSVRCRFDGLCKFSPYKAQIAWLTWLCKFILLRIMNNKIICLTVTKIYMA